MHHQIHAVKIIHGKRRIAQKVWLGADLQQLIDILHQQCVRIPIDDQAMPVQVFRYLGVSEVLEIVARTIDMGYHAQELALDQVELARRANVQGYIDFPHRQVQFAVRQLQTDFDLRIEFDKFLEPGRQPSRAERDRRLNF